MKVFWLKKYAEERLQHMYRSFIEPYSKSNVKIEDELPFNYLAVINPKDSNCIYTVHNLHFKVKDGNAIRILSSDNLEQHTVLREETSLQVVQQLNLQHKLDYRELDTMYDTENLLESNYAIILPGGSLVLETENAISEAALSIDWSAEEF
jgi:hypothetical protein